MEINWMVQSPRSKERRELLECSQLLQGGGTWRSEEIPWDLDTQELTGASLVELEFSRSGHEVGTV